MTMREEVPKDHMICCMLSLEGYLRVNISEFFECKEIGSVFGTLEDKGRTSMERNTARSTMAHAIGHIRIGLVGSVQGNSIKSFLLAHGYLRG